MKFFKISAILTILLSVNIFSQIPYYLNNEFETKSIINNLQVSSYLSNPGKVKFKDKLQAVNQRPYDILTYDVFLDWQKALSGTDTVVTELNFSGIQKISLQITEAGIDTIQLDAGFLKINSIELNGVKIIQDIQPVNDILSIPLDKKYNKDEKLSLKIGYDYFLSVDFNQLWVYNYGFYLFPKGKIKWGDRIVDNLHRIAYTFSEPELARYWMPCNDVPDDKAISSIAIQVPQGYSAASNGLLDSTISGTNSLGFYNIFYWSENNPIPPYLMLAFASEYQIMKDNYVRYTAPHDTIPILNYIWPEDYDTQGSAYNAKNSLKPTSEMMTSFSKLFGEYPTRKYGHGVLQPYSMGGMEHQTLTTINREWLRGNSEDGIAHELSHQWIGDLVTCQTWNDIWFNEGGASWAEALWEKEKAEKIKPGSGMAAYNKHLRDASKYYFDYNGLYSIPVYGVPVDYIFVVSGITYTKASWIFNMLYQQIISEKDELFLDFMNYIFNKYRFGNISTAVFHDELKTFLDSNNTYFDVDLFFDQWLYGAGHPIYNTTLKILREYQGRYECRIDIEQIQSQLGMREVFNCPVQFLFYKKGVVNSAMGIQIDKKVQFVEFSLGFIPDSIAINRDKLLCGIGSTAIVDVKESSTTTYLSIYPNPATDYIEINLDAINPTLKRRVDEDSNIQIFDMLGINVSPAGGGIKGGGRIDISFLSPGIYFIKIGNKVEKFVKM
jgi:aminopeptidase N